MVLIIWTIIWEDFQEDLIQWCQSNRRKRILFQNKEESETFDIQNSMLGGMTVQTNSLSNAYINGMPSDYSLNSQSNKQNLFSEPQISNHNMFSGTNQFGQMNKTSNYKNNAINNQFNTSMNGGSRAQNLPSTSNNFDDLFS